MIAREKIRDCAHYINREVRDNGEPLQDLQMKLIEKLKSYSSGDQEPMLWNSISADGYTFLHAMAGCDSLIAVQILISLGWNKYTTDNDGNNILHHAFSLKAAAAPKDFNFKVAQWSLNNGFQINHPNKFGQTALFLLADDLDGYEFHEFDQKSIFQLVEMFEAYGGDIYHRDHQGRTFLDVLPTEHEYWCEVDGVFDLWRAKIQKYSLSKEVQNVGVPQKKERKI